MSFLYGRTDDEIHCDMQAMADRIEELEAKLAEMTQMWLEACDVADLAGALADAEAKLD